MRDKRTVPHCIYCLEDDASAAFNREHVLPSAFGSFEHAFVLHDTVCLQCNEHFGSTLDLVLARGSDEGLQRYLLGTRPPEEVSRFRYDALTINYRDDDDYKGALIQLQADASASRGFKGVPADQVGFALADGSGFAWVPLSQVYDGSWKQREDLDWRRGVKIYAADHNAVREYLESEGVSHPKWRQMTRATSREEEITVYHIAELTPEVLRSVAKISFNYLAHVHGSAFALRPQFNDVRSFIRHGHDPGYPVVEADGEEIFKVTGDQPEGMRAAIHVLTVERPINADVVIGQVSLFGGLRYQVVLSTAPADDLVVSGHVFNPADQHIYQLGRRPGA